MPTHHTDERSKLDAILKEINVFKHHAVKVGVLSNANAHKSKNGESSEMVKIAATHEFGKVIKVTAKMRAYLHSVGIHLKPSTQTIHIPERSWLRSWVDENKYKIDSMIAYALGTVEDGRETASQALKKLGVWASNGIKVKIRKGPFAALKFRQGNPLNDTAQFRNSINSEVVKL